eukprot:scaffold37625_cov250-Skeletonema_dohrnii-CCMP3373.AAC.2
MRAIFSDGMDAYIAGDYDEAKLLFYQVLDETDGNDGPAQYGTKVIKSKEEPAQWQWKQDV